MLRQVVGVLMKRLVGRAANFCSRGVIALQRLVIRSYLRLPGPLDVATVPALVDSTDGGMG